MFMFGCVKYDSYIYPLLIIKYKGYDSKRINRQITKM